jgi:hypothetical protein
MTLAEFFIQLDSALAVFTNYDEKGMKDYINTHQQVFSYLEALREKNIIREFDMERFRLITNPEALHCTSEETTKLLEELKNYLLDTLIDKVQRENEQC